MCAVPGGGCPKHVVYTVHVEHHSPCFSSLLTFLASKKLSSKINLSLAGVFRAWNPWKMSPVFVCNDASLSVSRLSQVCWSLKLTQEISKLVKLWNWAGRWNCSFECQRVNIPWRFPFYISYYWKLNGIVWYHVVWPLGAVKNEGDLEKLSLRCKGKKLILVVYARV